MSEHTSGARGWTALGVLGLATVLLALDFSVMFLAQSRIAADLGAGPVAQLWISDSYGFALAGFLVTMGTLGDRLGCRRLLLAGSAVFGLASLAAAFATSTAMRIAARVLLGIAASAITPSTLALVRTLFDNPRQRGTAIGIWVGCFMGGTAVGPVVGGALLERFWWGAAFLIGVPVMLVVLVAGALLLPEYRDPDPGRLDPVSVAMFLAWVLPAICGLKQLAAGGSWPPALLALVAGVLAGVAFVRRQLRLAHPFLDLRLFRNRVFRGALLALVVNAVVLSGLTLLISQWTQLVAGFSPLRTALCMAPGSVAIAATSVLAPVAARRWRPAYVIAAGLGLTVLGCLLYTQAAAGAPPSLALVGYGVMVLGAGPVVSLSTEVVVSSAPESAAGAAAAVKETADNLGIGLGIALLGSVATAVSRAAGGPPAVAFSSGVQVAGVVGALLTLGVIALSLNRADAAHLPYTPHPPRAMRRPR